MLFVEIGVKGFVLRYFWAIYVLSCLCQFWGWIYEGRDSIMSVFDIMETCPLYLCGVFFFLLNCLCFCFLYCFFFVCVCVLNDDTSLKKSTRNKIQRHYWKYRNSEIIILRVIGVSHFYKSIASALCILDTVCYCWNDVVQWTDGCFF